MRGSRFWPIVGVLFLAVNLGGAIYALVMGEIFPHAAIHGALFVAGLFLMQQFAKGRDARRLWLRPTPTSAPAGMFDDQLSHLEQSLDAVAVEVERIGEAQRFMTQVVAERGARAEPATPEDPNKKSVPQ